MKLHRAKRSPDWTDIPEKNRNLWQKLAAHTNGIITPGNLFTMLGLFGSLLTVYFLATGLYGLSLVALIASRLFDIVDGWIADVTKTKSPLGEILDAAIDKISLAILLVVFALLEVVPWWLALLLLSPHLVIAWITLVARRQKTFLHPTRLGKLNMFASSVTLIGFVTVQALPIAQQNIAKGSLYLIVMISAAFGVAAAYDYARLARKTKSASP